MIKKLAVIAAAAILTACGGGGSLEGEKDLGYYDFNYRPTYDQPYTALGSKTITLQARVVWDGPKGEPVTTVQHVPMAFAQVTAPGLQNSEGETLWTHAVGAYIGTQGLALELWDRDNGYTRGTFWTQEEGRCAMATDGSLQGDTMCLDEEPNPVGYLTPAPTFQLKKGTSYILTFYIVPGTGGWATLQAKLYEASPELGVIELQSAVLGFEMARYFPDPNQPLRAAIARTPGGPGDLSVRYEFLGDTINFTDGGRKLTTAEARSLR